MVLACWALRAVALFSLLLIGVYGGHEICQHGQCQLVPATSVLEYWSMFSELVIVLAIGFFMGSIFGWRAHVVCCRWTARASDLCALQRTVATQSQVRYCWGRSDPRFVPLADREQGVWVNYQPPDQSTT